MNGLTHIIRLKMLLSFFKKTAGRRFSLIFINRYTLTIFYLLFLLFSSNNLLSQNKHIDSLKFELKINRGDTIRVSILNELAWEYQRIDIEKAQNYALKAKLLSDSLSYEKGITTSLNRLAQIAYFQYDFMLSEELFLNLLEKEIQNGNEYGIGQAYYQLSAVYSKLMILDRALDFALKANEKFRLVGSKKAEAVSYRRIGNILVKQEKYDDAIENYLIALKIYESSGIKKNISHNYLVIANAYTKKKDFDKALYYINQAMHSLKESGNSAQYFQLYSCLGNFYYLKKELKEAEKYYKQALELVTESGSTNELAALQNLTKISFEKGDSTISKIYGNRYSKLIDSLKNEKFNYAKLKYQTEKKEIKVAQLKLEDKKSKLQREMLLIYVISTLLILIVLLISFKILFNKK